MKRILFILFLLTGFAAIAQPTATSPLGSTNKNVFNKIGGSLLVDSFLRLGKYATLDTNKVLGFDASGNAVFRTKSTGGSADTTIIATKWYVNTTVSDTAAGLRALMVSLFSGYYNKTQIDNFFANYYNKAESDGRYSQLGHTHAYADITGKPSTFAPSAHTHPQSDVTGLDVSLNSVNDSIENALKYIQLNNITTAAAQLDYVIMDGDTNTWDTDFREIGNVVWFPKINKYVFMYAGHTGTYVQNNIYLGVMTSPDLKTWTKVGADGKISTRSGEDPYMIVKGDSIYAYCEDKEDVPFRNIRMYVTTDAVTWYDKGDVLDIGTTGAWDSRDVSSPVVRKIGDTTYMWFEGRATGQLGAIGMATSTDMYNWTKYGGNPVITGYNLPDSTIRWASHVVSHDIDVVNDDIYLFVAPYMYSIPDFQPSIVLGNINKVYEYRDYLGTWLNARRDIKQGGTKLWVNNRYVLFAVDTSNTKLVQMKYTNVPTTDFVNKPIITDDSIRGKYLQVKNAAGFTSTISSPATVNRADTLPDKSGTFAMTSDIPDVTVYKEKDDSVDATGYVPQHQLDTAKNNIRIGMAATYLPITDTTLMLSNYLRTNVATATYVPYTGAISNLDLGLFNITVGGTATVDTVNGGTASGVNLQLTSTSNPAKGKIRLGALSGYDEVNDRLGIGTSSPAAKIEVVGGQIRAINYGGVSNILGLSIGGTSGSPTATPAGQEIAAFCGSGSTDGVTLTGRRAAFSIKAAENWTSTANGTALDFKVTANGATGVSDAGRIDQDRKWLIGTTSNNGRGNNQVSGGLELTEDTLIAPVIKETTVTSGLIKADANGVHAIATPGTDYLNSTYIEDAINNGTTNKAPSENAVYDALVLKKDIATDTVVWAIAASDLTTALTTGTNKAYFRMPYAATLVKVKASVLTVSSSGTPTFDINEGGTSVLGTKLSVDASEKTSETAASAATITDSALARDAEITIDIDTAGTGTAGAIIYLYWIKA